MVTSSGSFHNRQAVLGLPPQKQQVQLGTSVWPAAYYTTSTLLFLPPVYGTPFSCRAKRRWTISMIGYSRAVFFPPPWQVPASFMGLYVPCYTGVPVRNAALEDPHIRSPCLVSSQRSSTKKPPQKDKSLEGIGILVSATGKRRRLHPQLHQHHPAGLWRDARDAGDARPAFVVLGNREKGSFCIPSFASIISQMPSMMFP